MREPKPIDGARALLFERLTDFDPKSQSEKPELESLRILDRNGLKKSVRRELEWLLSTRSPLPTHLFGAQELSVLDYGIPDFSSFSAKSSHDRERLGSIIERAIRAFEPRLQNVRVTVEPVPNKERVLAATVEGVLVVGSIMEAVSFPLLLDGRTGAVELYETQ